jgi:hypothetical protein
LFPLLHDVVHRDDLLIGEEAAKLFNFHSYALRNFSQHTSGVFRRKTVTPDQLLCFSMVCARPLSPDVKELLDVLSLTLCRVMLATAVWRDHTSGR